MLCENECWAKSAWVIKITVFPGYPSIISTDQLTIFILIYQYRAISESKSWNSNMYCSIGFPLCIDIISNRIFTGSNLRYTPYIILWECCVSIITVRIFTIDDITSNQCLILYRSGCWCRSSGSIWGRDWFAFFSKEYKFLQTRFKTICWNSLAILLFIYEVIHHK